MESILWDGLEPLDQVGMTLERGTLLHKRYRIVEILGQGGMGSVYRAVDENLGVDVAVKENLFTSDEYSKQFRLEAVILAGMRHPNLPRVSDHFAVGDQGQYLVMDFIEGEDLRQRMERVGTISEEDAVMVGAAICDALTYLHTRKPSILHRDVKPGNVKIAPDGSIFLLDFGLAKLVQGPQATTTGARAMTPGYSPPEQYGAARTDPRTDIYSLGATLYAALCGLVPEDGLARAMDTTRLTPLRRRNPKVARRVAAAIEKAMAVDPADRFQTAEDFKTSLLSAISRTERPPGEFTVTPPPDVPYPPEQLLTGTGGPSRKAAMANLPELAVDTGKPFVPARRRSRSPAWLLLLFILIVASADMIVLFPEDVPSNVRESLPFLFPAPASTPTATVHATASEFPTVTALAPAGIVVRTATLAATPTSKASPTSAATASTRAVSAPTATAGPLRPAPGGGAGQMAFASDRSGIPQIYLVDLNGGTALPITNMPNGACQPSWSPDGRRLVFVSPCRVSPMGRPPDISEVPSKNTALYTMNADGSDLVALPTVPGGDSEPAWSPDGTRIAFTSIRDGPALIFVLNLADQSVTRLTDPSPDYAAARQSAWSPFSNQIAFCKKRVDTYQIWTMTDNGQGQQQIAGNGQLFWDYSPAWSPDGKSISFTERNASGPVLPWEMNIAYEKRDTASASRLKLGPLPVEDARFSPDGLWVAFESKSPGENRDIFYATITGDQRTRVTADPGIDFDPAWRPAITP